jgi:hypothetical protein
MSRKLYLLSSEGILYDELEGPFDLVTLATFFEGLHRVWQRSPQMNILSDFRRVNFTLSAADVRDFIENIRATKMGVQNRVAVLYRKREGFDLPRFFEFLTLKENREFKVYEDFEEAFNWIFSRRLLLG